MSRRLRRVPIVGRVVRRRQALQRRGRLEHRQLHDLVRAYRRDGPEVLVLGDSTTFWFGDDDVDRRSLTQMVQAHLPSGLRVFEVAGAGFNPRIMRSYLLALERCPMQPRVLVVSLFQPIMMRAWLDHPSRGFVRAARSLEAAVGDPAKYRSTTIPGPDPSEFAAYDLIAGTSFVGLDRSFGQLRAVTASRPRSEVEQAARRRDHYDGYLSERLEQEGVAAEVITELGRAIKACDVPWVAVQPPIDHEGARTALAVDIRAHLVANARTITEAFERGAGSGQMVDATTDAPAGDFFDPLHLADVGRLRLAPRIAAAIATACRSESSN